VSYYTERGQDLANSWHEIGHCVVARALGLSVPLISIDRDFTTRELGRPADGFCSIPDLHRAPTFDQTTILRAGIVGSRLGDYPFHDGGVGGDFVEIFRVLDAAGVPGYEQNAVIARSDRRAEKLIRENWKLAEALVEQLVSERTIRFTSPTVARAVEPAQPKPIIQVRREMLPLMTRSATTRSAKFADAHTFECIWSSGATVRRVDSMGDRFDEELLMGSSNVDMSRIANGSAPLLAAHDASGLNSVIGVVERAWLADGFAHARVRMSKNPANAGVVQDVRDGILHNLSCGYRIDKAERIQRVGNVDLLRATRWTPMELSLVAIPADPSASIKSNAPTFAAEVMA
jgi:hypothetical protein